MVALSKLNAPPSEMLGRFYQSDFRANWDENEGLGGGTSGGLPAILELLAHAIFGPCAGLFALGEGSSDPGFQLADPCF